MQSQNQKDVLDYSFSAVEVRSRKSVRPMIYPLLHRHWLSFTHSDLIVHMLCFLPIFWCTHSNLRRFSFKITFTNWINTINVLNMTNSCIPVLRSVIYNILNSIGVILPVNLSLKTTIVTIWKCLVTIFLLAVTIFLLAEKKLLLANVC